MLASLGVPVQGVEMESAGYRVGERWAVRPSPNSADRAGASQALRSCVCLERKQLQDALADALAEQERLGTVKVVRGVGVKAVLDGGRSVTLDGGEDVHDIDLLVGADGLKSVVTKPTARTQRLHTHLSRPHHRHAQMYGS